MTQEKYFPSDINHFLNMFNSNYCKKNYKKFYDKNKYIPKYFDLYNSLEVKNGIHPTLTTASSGKMVSGTILVIEDI